MDQAQPKHTIVATLIALSLCGLTPSLSFAQEKSPYTQSSLEILNIVASSDLAKILGPKRSIDAILRVKEGYTVISEECTVSVFVDVEEGKPTPARAGIKFTYGPLVCGE